MSDDGSGSPPWHWHEYAIGTAGESAHAFDRVLGSFLIGLGAAFALILGAGILAEENLLGDPGLENAIDHLMRLSVGLLMGIGLVTWAVGSVASYLREATTSRALAKAAEQGASRFAVPSPEQVLSVTQEPAGVLKFFALANAVLVGIIGVIGLFIVMAEGDEESLLITGIAIGYASVMAFIGLVIPKWLDRGHQRRQARIAACWSAEDEAGAWKRARQSPGRKGKKTAKRSTAAESCIGVAGGICMLGFLALQGSLMMRCAGSGKYDDCDEVTYGSFIEQVLAVGFWIFAAAVPLAALLAVIGVVLGWRRRRAERAGLLAHLADPRSEGPDNELLAYHSQRNTPALAFVATLMSAVGLVFSLASYMLGRGSGLGSQEVFAEYRTESLIGIAVSVGMLVAALLGTGIVNARGRELRNALRRRWPRQPSWSVANEGQVPRAKRGPALHAPRFVQVGNKAKSG